MQEVQRQVPRRLSGEKKVDTHRAGDEGTDIRNQFPEVALVRYGLGISVLRCPNVDFRPSFLPYARPRTARVLISRHRRVSQGLRILVPTLLSKPSFYFIAMHTQYDCDT